MPLLIILVVGGALGLGGCALKKIHDKAEELEKKRERERQQAETNGLNAVQFTLPSETRFSAFVLARATKPVVQASPMAQWETSTNLEHWEATEFPELNINEPKRFFRIKP